MRASFTGNFRAFDRFARQIDSLTKPGFFRDVSDELADESLELIDRGFASHRDPYGKPWAPKKGGGRLLFRSGKMQRGFSKRRVGPHGFTVGTIGEEYPFFHQRGTKGPYTIRARKAKALRLSDGRFRKSVQHPGVPQRMMVPERSRGMPKAWSSAFAGRAVGLIRKRFK